MTDVLILQHVRPEPPGNIAEVLEERSVSTDIVQIFRGDPVPESLEADGLVVMGGPMGIGDLDNRPHLSKELTLIEEALRDDRPVLGVCLGSQLLAHVLGAEVQPGPEKEIGWDEVTLTDAAANDPLFRDVDESFTPFHWHGDVFALPDGAVSLARSAQTEHQAFRYGERAYGLLFHLEVTPKTVAWMTKAFQDELAEEGLDGAAIRREAMTHEPSLRDTARTVFGRWADLVVESDRNGKR
jgi:GMP synthase (glutamine-hydrolysing)